MTKKALLARIEQLEQQPGGSMTDHELNKLLAEVAGVEVLERTIVDNQAPLPRTTELGLPTKIAWLLPEEDQGSTRFREWTPLTDHNQMALVKAGLREQRWGYMVTVIPTHVTVNLIKDGDSVWSPTVIFGMHPTDECRALADAVAQMVHAHKEAPCAPS